jgi:hypothetical protein
VDQFPQTESTCKSADFRLRAVPANERKCVRNPDIQVLVSCHVETVVLLSKKNAKPKDCVEISVDAEDYYRIKSSEKDI